LGQGVKLDFLITNYPLSPAGIINVIIRVWRLTIGRGETVIKANELELCIRDESLKAGLT
jgi:hypothetical protein